MRTNEIALWWRAACLAAAMTGIASAQPGPDRVSSIERAAAEIAAIQAKSGSDGAFAAIDECYKREIIWAKSLTRELETCVVQDIIVSKVTAAFYARLSPEGRKMGGGEEPKVVLERMAQRVTSIFARFKIPQDEARAFNQVVETKGMEAYGRARFPGQFPEKKN